MAKKQFLNKFRMSNVNVSDESVELQERRKAFESQLRIFAIVNKVQRLDIEGFLNDAFHIYESELEHTVELHNMVKSMTTLVAEFEKNILTTNANENGNENENDNNANESGEQTIKETLYFSTPVVIIGTDSDLKQNYEINIIDEILKSVEETAIRGSGFTLARIIELNVQISSYRPLRGSSFVKTPDKLEWKKAIVNVKNTSDDMCFKWAILSALHPAAQNPHRLQNYLQYENELNFDGINFPVSLKDIDKFVKQNEQISVNVYYYDDDKVEVCPLRVSNIVKEHHIHLLLLIGNNRINTNGADTTENKIKVMLESDQIQAHYCWIKNLSRLLSSQLTKHGHTTFICDRCLNYFISVELLAKHSKNCTNECRIEMPLSPWISFKNTEFQLKAPFIIYADCEAILKRLSDEEQNHVFTEGCSTSAYQEHIIYSVGYYFKCEFNDALSYYAYSGNKVDCVEWFINELSLISQTVAQMLSENEPIKPLNDDEKLAFNDLATVCSICAKPFKMTDIRVRDHCHFTGNYRGPAHNECNLNYQESRTIPIVMHNLSGYDAHLLIRKLATEMDGDISVIPNNVEQYISFTKVVNESTRGHCYKEKIKLKFIDSCRFMPASLNQLASLLPADKKRILYSEGLKEYSHEQLTMLQRKGVFPYDYVDSFERLNETALPSQAEFYSELNDDEIDDEEYEFACKIWEKFQIKTLGEYSELYLKTDVLLLADVFENFRDSCHNIYKLDPAHYFTSPGLSFDAMLKYTGVVIELIADIEMMLFVERGIRGGISQCGKRYAKANNKYMKTDFKPNEKTNFLMYLDGMFFLSA